MKKVVVLLSGGLDSTTLAYLLKSEGYKLFTLSFNYGQRHKKELECAEEIAKILNSTHKTVDITSITSLISKGALTGSTPVPHSHYTAETQKITIVPNRNSILLSLAFGYAVKLGISNVAYAAHKNDFTIYPDCREDFASRFEDAIRWANDNFKLNLLRPLINKTKAEIVKLGLSLKVPYQKTWSCYEGDDLACGQCGTCQERLEAFRLNNAKDPIQYKVTI